MRYRKLEPRGGTWPLYLAMISFGMNLFVFLCGVSFKQAFEGLPRALSRYSSISSHCLASRQFCNHLPSLWFWFQAPLVFVWCFLFWCCGLSNCPFSTRPLVGLPVVLFYLFFGEGSPTKIDKKERSGYPFSNLSTRGPSILRAYLFLFLLISLSTPAKRGSA